jgi:hypothetical protein
MHRRFTRSLASACICVAAQYSCLCRADSAGIRVPGPGTQPHIGFACCDGSTQAMQALFADPQVMTDLKSLHAMVAVAIIDFSPERAGVVRQLNQAGIPAVAWIQLPKEEGFYLNAGNAPAAWERVRAFEQWTQENRLVWSGVGLDIEPNFDQFSGFRNRKGRILLTLLEQILNGARMRQARRDYSALIAKIQADGYPVQTYQMPYLPAERSVHSTLLDRMLGTVDVRGNTEYLMLYTTFARRVGAGMIWSLGRDAQGISVGLTSGDGTPGTDPGPLSWDEFSRDLIVAGHYTPEIGVYNLEGCVRRGYLDRLTTFDWSQSVIIPAASVEHAQRMGLFVRTVLWTGSNLPWLMAAVLLLILWLFVRRRKRGQSGV